MKRKLSFIMSAIANPKFKFLDEPSTGLDPIARKSLREVIVYQKKVYKGSTVLTTHSMSEAEDVCDKIAILVNGHLCVVDSIKNLRKMVKGYNLTVFKIKECESDKEMEACIKRVFGLNKFEKLTIVDEGLRKVVYDFAEVDDLPEKLRLMQGIKDKGIIRDFSFS